MKENSKKDLWSPFGWKESVLYRRIIQNITGHTIYIVIKLQCWNECCGFRKTGRNSSFDTNMLLIHAVLIVAVRPKFSGQLSAQTINFVRLFFLSVYFIVVSKLSHEFACHDISICSFKITVISRLDSLEQCNVNLTQYLLHAGRVDFMSFACIHMLLDGRVRKLQSWQCS